MTQEEKAKAYDEALERARKMVTTEPQDHTDAILKDIFPQLRESKDERARKAALEGIEYLERKLGWDFIGDTDILDVKEYLEKQKEQKTTPDWMPKFLDELRSKKNYFDWDEHRDIEGHILAIINWIAPNYFDRKEKEQKPAEWGEEDEIKICFLKNLIQYQVQDGDYCFGHYGRDYVSKREAIEMLSSLRPRTHWKPSNEQIEALEHFIRSCGESGTMTPQNTILRAANSLLNELKKL